MAITRVGRLTGLVAIGLAILGSVIAFSSELARYRDTGFVDRGHIAIAVAAPLIIGTVVWLTAFRDGSSG